MSTLSPWDLSGLGMGFGLYRPRRPSYTYATQMARQRSESYRYAVRKSTSESDEPPDFIEGIIQQKNRKESYIRATRKEEHVPVEMTDICNSVSDAEANDINNHPTDMQTSKRNSRLLAAHGADNYLDMDELKVAISKKRSPRLSPRTGRLMGSQSPAVGTKTSNSNHSLSLSLKEVCEDLKDDSVFMPVHQNQETGEVMTPCSEDSNVAIGVSVQTFTFKKNLILLCASFILIFSAFRAIQNLQSSFHNEDDLGIIAMSCIYGTMFLTSVWAPMFINKLTAKWALVCGMLTFLVWTAANFYPRFYTLIPFGILAGLGQGVLWTAESSYILKLAFDSSRISKDGLEKEVFRFHGIFLACFQTTHIWGNLISSLILLSAKNSIVEEPLFGPPMYYYGENDTFMMPDSAAVDMDQGPPPTMKTCGVLYQCDLKVNDDITGEVPSVMWKLMSAYLILGFIGFCLIFLCLDRIGAKVEPEKTGYQIVVQHMSLMISHKTFRLLVPLLIFSGLQQGFVYADFNQAYVTCAMGVEYIGFSMIIMGLANVISAILVAVCANLVPREVVFGIGGIIHMGLMIGFLIWIPEHNLTIFFILAASWGLCDAVWQTQCNTLICITCPEDTDIAFANYRMLQSLGLTMGFLSGTFLCVSFKLYILMILLVVAIMFYVLAEYKVRQVDNNDSI